MFTRTKQSQLVNICYRIVLNQTCRLKSRYAVNPVSSGDNRRGRFSRPKQTNRSDAECKNSLDDEAYHDRDFEYIDHRQQWRQKQIDEKFGLGQEFKKDNNSVKSVFGRKHKNALYEDDDDDLKLAEFKRDFGNSNKQMVNKLHRQFKKEQESKQIYQPKSDSQHMTSHSVDNNVSDKIARKKKYRKLIPLPYNMTEENRFDILNQIVIPYYKTSYQTQLKRKYQHNVQILRKFGEKLRQIDGPIRVNRNGLACTLEPVRASPRTEQYRNKDEFSVWPGIDGNDKTVGFFVGQPSVHDRVICVEPDQVVITKQTHIDLAKKFQQYLRDVSPYDSCQNYGEAGNWRRIHIRSNEANAHMVTAIMHPQDLTPEQLKEEMDRLRNYFSDDPLIKSLYFHASRHTRSTHTSEPYYHLFGDTTISERLFDKQFVISPSSFFQVNTTAAEVLYRVIMSEVNSKKKNTTLLDLCCGTGTLSVLMSSHVKNIIAIDSSKSAIEDAKRNAAANGVHNVTFLSGTVEDILPKLAEEETHLSGHVVAVANPSRRALHPNAIRTLRRMNYIQKLVYVSCKPDGDAFDNFVQLCRPRSDSGSPFCPVNAVPVDLFPHTDHCELVLTFERF